MRKTKKFVALLGTQQEIFNYSYIKIYVHGIDDISFKSKLNRAIHGMWIIFQYCERTRLKELAIIK